MKKSFLFCLLVALLIPWATTQAESLTVNDGTTTNLYVPIYGWFADTSGKSQFIVPSGDASDMEGGSISGLSFYASSDFAFSAIWEVRLLETDETSVSSSFVDVSSASLVYTGTIPISGGIASITFDEAFEYGGNNLLIEISLKTTGNCSTSSSPLWYGVSTGTSRGGSSGSPASRDFLPKTTFIYEAAATGTCPKPKSLLFSDIAARAANLSWDGGTASAWQICINDDEENLINVSSASYSFANLTPLTEYSVKVRAVCGEEQSEWSAKNFTTTSACPYEITIAPVATITTTTAEINVTEATGEAEAIEARYFHGNDTVVLDSEADEIDFKGEEGTISLVNLLPATTYGIQVRAYCEEEGAYGEWSAVTNFTTKCEAVSAIDENFDGITAGSGVLPTCWSRINEASYYNYYPYVYNSSSSAHSGSNSLYFSTSNSSSYADEYAILPELDNLSGKRIVFWAKQGSSAATLQVGEMTDPADASTFIQTGSNVTLSSSYQKFTINLEGYGNYVAFKVVKPTSGYIYVYIDDIVVEEIPSCLEPSGLAASEIAATSAKLAWTKGDEETAWQLCINGDEENLLDIAENPYVLSDLNALTSYKVKVRAKCSNSDQSAWGDSVQFTTPAIPVVVGDAWSDDFEGASCGWELINGTQTNAWAWGEATHNGGTHALYVSNDGGVSNAYSNTASMVYATKLLTFENGKYQFSYDWMAKGEDNWDFLRVFLIPATTTLTAGTTPRAAFLQVLILYRPDTLH